MNALMVVCDDALERRLSAVFVSRQVPVTVRRSAAEARAAGLSGEYAIVLLDLELGLEDLAELCAEYRQLPWGQFAFILGLGSGLLRRSLRGALAAGLDDVLDRSQLDYLRLRLEVGQRRRDERRHFAALRQRHQTLLETLEEGVVLVDREGRIESANSRLAELTGYSLAELSGRSVDRMLVDDQVRQRLPGGALLGTVTGSEQYSLPIRRKDGSELWVSLNAAPSRGLDGRGGASLGVMRDLSDLRQIEADLRYREEYFRVLSEAASDLVTLLDLEGRVLYQSPSAKSLLGYAPEELVGLELAQLVPEEDRPLLDGLLDRVLVGSGHTASADLRILNAQGQHRHLECLAQNLLDNPVVGGLVLTSRDISDKKLAEAALRRERAFFQQLFDNSPTAIVVLDNDETVLDANSSFVELFGHDLEELRGKNLSRLIVPTELREESHQLSQAVFQRRAVERETVRRCRDGRLVDVAVLGYPIALESQRIGAFGIYTDISRRKQAERKLFHEAFHDPLTGLPNRALLLETLVRALRRVRRLVHEPVAVLFVDLDGFKRINDHLGHQVGDEVLQEVALRLEREARPGDLVARLGGDEFVVLLDDLQTPGDAPEVAERVLRGLAEPYELSEGAASLSCSIGLAFGTRDYDSAEDLLRDADLAMYRAKQRGKNRFEVFEGELQRRVLARLNLQQELKDAIDGCELELYYQPLVPLPSGMLQDMEGLVRWRHPERGLLEAGELLAAAAETHLLQALGRRVLSAATTRLGHWQRALQPQRQVRVWVNLSTEEAALPGLAEVVRESLAAHDVVSEGLGFEVNAESLLQDGVVEGLANLAELGCPLAVDDLGRGAVPLDQLLRLPLTLLKLAPEMVTSLTRNDPQRNGAEVLLEMARGLGAKLVGKGVETEAQRRALQANGVHFGQGFLFSRPVPVNEADQMLRSDPRW